MWYAWDIRMGERVGGLVFASFNHSAGSLDSAVSPAEDWADWRVTGAPHSEFTNLETYRYLPTFEARLKAGQPSLKEETLWYRLVTGGEVPKYLRLRPRSRLSAVTEGADDPVLAQANSMITRVSVELLLSEPSLTIDVAGAGRN